ncbi:MAG: hypothetical protein AAF518_24550, partial [Spirochaetota bacterium]
DNLLEIKNNSPILQKEKKPEKLIAAIENAIMHHSSVIVIPKEIVPKNKSDTIIINKSDFKSPLFRSQLAEHFRYQIAVNNTSNTLHQYYNFIINCIEVEYPKYIRKKTTKS